MAPIWLDVLDQTVRVCATQGRPDLARRLRQKREQLLSPTLRVLVTGRPRQGKSQLINALINAQACPVGGAHGTAIPTVVHHAEIPVAALVRAPAAPPAPPAPPADLEAELADTRERLHRIEQENAELQRWTEEELSNPKRRHKRTRPAALRGTTRRMQSPLGDLYVTINEDERGRPFELFATLGKAGGAAMADVEAIGRLVSLALRSGIPLQEVYQQLRGISCDRAVGVGPNKVLSVPDAIAQAIERHEREKAGIQQELPIPRAAQPAPAAAAQAQLGFQAYDPGETFLGTCPECSADLKFMEGCVTCMACGYSECG